MTDTPKNVTAILADFVLNSRFENIPEDCKKGIRAHLIELDGRCRWWMQA